MSTAAKPRRVLIADDHAPTRADVRRVLDHDERFEVCAEAADAAGAVQAALREKPDVCLLDLGMPGNGMSAVWEIAARMPETKIVILTVSDQEDNLFAALQAGASGYLPKTMNLNRLPDTLDGVCHGEAALPRTAHGACSRAFPPAGAPLAANCRCRAGAVAADEPGMGSPRSARAGVFDRRDR